MCIFMYVSVYVHTQPYAFYFILNSIYFHNETKPTILSLPGRKKIIN